MDGLLLINKPIGITSFDVIRRLRRITAPGKIKIGHAGTLDPLATGLMLMLFGAACKQAGRLSKLDKTYRAELTLGAGSSTGDAEGEKTAVSPRRPAIEEIERTLRRFTGQITQTPPIYSAIKIKGREAYKLARKGQTPKIPSRTVTVYSLVLTSYEYPTLTLEAAVSSGTYIRTLAQDIGQRLSTGAYLSGLVRTRVGPYELAQAVELEGATSQTVASALLPVST
ncbi:tRNA pseudouridine(55) synthase TruB [Candidatus Parcubacteria bacterium]|nr:tRNA pseudouridine(55) synthase TruB [Candidatus Parcubacteria bacterium]